MSSSFHVDHHLQSSILDVLEEHGEQSFSALKPADVENSLFMYHTRKLISRGIVEKSPDGFRLTPEGARWINQVSPNKRMVELPRPLVQLIVIHNDQILISERIEHMAEHLNHYMLPGGLHAFGQTSLQNAERIAAKFDLKLTSDRIGQAEVIIQSKNHHSLVDFYAADTLDVNYLFNDDLFKLRFIPISEILDLSPDEANALPEIIKHTLAKTLSFHTFVVD